MLDIGDIISVGRFFFWDMMFVGWYVVCDFTVSYAYHGQTQTVERFFLGTIFYRSMTGAESRWDVGTYTAPDRITPDRDAPQATDHLYM